jgi:hypothetical protein
MQRKLPNLRSSVQHEYRFSQAKGKRLWHKGEHYPSKKNMVAGIRLIRFATQIMQHGRIVDHKCANSLLISTLNDEVSAWNHYEK